MNDMIISDVRELAIKYLDNLGVAKGLTPEQKDTFIEICSGYQLNPFKREIWAIKYGNDFSIIVGYETYLKRAERTGKLDGWNTTTSGDVKIKYEADRNGQRKAFIDRDASDLCVTLTIYRKDWSHPFIHEAHISEFCGSSPIWIKSPKFMLKKVAVSQGFRLCFPDEMGGLPYTSEEFETFKPEITTITPDYSIKSKTVTKSECTELLNAKLHDASNEYEHYSELISVSTTDAELENIHKKLTAMPPKAPAPAQSETAIKQATIDILEKLIANGKSAVYVRNSVKKHLGIVSDEKDWKQLIWSAPLDIEVFRKAYAHWKAEAQKPEPIVAASLESERLKAFELLSALPESDAYEYRSALNDCSTIEEISRIMNAIKSEVNA